MILLLLLLLLTAIKKLKFSGEKLVKVTSRYQRGLLHVIFEFRLYNIYWMGSSRPKFHELSPGFISLQS